MSRAPVKRQGNYLAGDVWTNSFAAFFTSTQWYNGADIVLDEGIIAADEDTEDDSIKEDLPEIDRLMSELLFAGLVNNFQAYLADLLLELFRFKPQVLSGGTVKNSVVFDHPDIESLKRHIIERQVLDLAYKRIEEIDEFFRDRFKFPLVQGKLTAARLNRIIQVRNVITHNRGRVNRQLQYKAGFRSDVEGDKVQIPNLYATDLYLIRLAEKIDRNAINVFGLPHNSGE